VAKSAVSDCILLCLSLMVTVVVLYECTHTHKRTMKIFIFMPMHRVEGLVSQCIIAGDVTAVHQ